MKADGGRRTGERATRHSPTTFHPGSNQPLMRCLVTGATGFVGGHLCERLVAEGHEVLALARPGSRRGVLEPLQVEIVEGTLDSMNVFARVASSCDVVFHLAALTKALHRREFRKVNVTGTERLISGLARGAFQGRLVMLSSLSAGGPAPDPNTPRRIEDPDRPVSHYGRSKRDAERLLRRHVPEGAQYTILRPGAIYGPREQDFHQVFRTLASWGLIVQTTRPVRLQMTHVEDVVSALLVAATKPEAAGRTYYATDTATWTDREIMQLAAEALGRRVRTVTLPVWTATASALLLDGLGKLARRPIAPLTRDKVREMNAANWFADATPLREELGWQPRWPLPDGLQQTIKWYKAEGWL